MKKLLFLLALPCFAQSPVFTQFTPTIIRMTIGSSMCTGWSQLPPPWPLIIYCVGPTSKGMLPFSYSDLNDETTWDWRNTDTKFTWTIRPSKSAPAPALDWQIVGTPTGGDSVMKQGIF